jgi:hypothetical protein
MYIIQILTLAVFSFFSSTSFASGTVIFEGQKFIRFNDNGAVYNEFGVRIARVEHDGKIYDSGSLIGFVRNDGQVFRYPHTEHVGKVNDDGRVTSLEGRIVGRLRESPITNLGRAAAAIILLMSESTPTPVPTPVPIPPPHNPGTTFCTYQLKVDDSVKMSFQTFASPVEIACRISKKNCDENLPQYISKHPNASVECFLSKTE